MPQVNEKAGRKESVNREIVKVFGSAVISAVFGGCAMKYSN